MLRLFSLVLTVCVLSFSLKGCSATGQSDSEVIESPRVQEALGRYDAKVVLSAREMGIKEANVSLETAARIIYKQLGSEREKLFNAMRDAGASPWYIQGFDRALPDRIIQTLLQARKDGRLDGSETE